MVERITHLPLELIFISFHFLSTLLLAVPECEKAGIQLPPRHRRLLLTKRSNLINDFRQSVGPTSAHVRIY